MPEYLDAYMSAIPAGQRKAITRLLNQYKQAGLIESSQQFGLELQRMVQELSTEDDWDARPVLFVPPDNLVTTIQSDRMNSNFQNIYATLTGLFEQMNRADETIRRHRQVRDSEAATVRAAINKLLEDVSIFQFLSTPGNTWSEAKFSNFWNVKNANKTVKSAEVDDLSKFVRCRIGSSRRIHQLAGTAPTTIEVESFGGGQDNLVSKNFDPGRALDNDLDTFWAHLLLADSPVRSVINGSTLDGAVVQVTVTFPAIEFVSMLRMYPFGSHPVEFSNLQYWTGTTWADLTGWTALPASLEWQEFAFEQVQTDKIRFLMRQQNFTRNTYLIPRRMFANALLWELVADQELLLGVEEEDLTDQQKIAVEANPRFRALAYGLQRFSDRLGESGLNLEIDDIQELSRTMDAATRVMSETREDDAGLIMRFVDPEGTSAPTLAPDDMVEVSKVEYLMGLYHLDIEHRDYFPIGIYESPKYDNQGVVYEVALDVDEEHVQDSDAGGSFNLSSAEYQIEVAPDRKVNILPYGDTRAPEELLFVDPNTFKARLRFTPDVTPNMQVRKDGKVTTAWSLSGQELTITSGFNRNSIYTASYDAPDQDVFDLDATFDSRELVRPEIFTETDDNGMVKLSYYPYVAWAIVNDRDNWVRPDTEHALYVYRVENGTVVIDGISYGPAADEQRTYEPILVLVDGIRASNITDYRGRVHPAFADVPQNSLVYQYIHVGKKLYFNRPITNATIEVRYRWMTQYVKLVATLRGHQAVINPYTPHLRNFRLRMRTSRL